MQLIFAADWQPAIAALQTRLEQRLAEGQAVLWLVSGGSNIAASVQIMDALDAGLTKNLTVLPVDERYGVVGHPDSNFGQLLAAGFDLKLARIIQILQPEMSFQATAKRFNDLARQVFSDSDYIIGQLGMGPDGHIAGILPHSLALSSPDFVAAYTSQPYQRLTLTQQALKHLHVAYVLAFGHDKRSALEQLATQLVPYADQPAQMLKELPEAYVFSDQIEV